jgi:hypothetical protein
MAGKNADAVCCCKKCAQRWWRKKNPEKARIKDGRKYWKDPEKYRAKMRDKRSRNPDHVRGLAVARYHNEPEKYKAAVRASYRGNEARIHMQDCIDAIQQINKILEANGAKNDK